MLDKEDVITQIMDLSWDNCDDLETLQEIEDELQQCYGLSYNEYSTLRNNLLIKNNYSLPIDTLRMAITNKITIDLVYQGLLEISKVSGTNIFFSITVKGQQLIHQAYDSGSLQESNTKPFYALMFLRNSKIV
jgi:hypothetical protein